jgi:hypothetical protein
MVSHLTKEAGVIYIVVKHGIGWEVHKTDTDGRFMEIMMIFKTKKGAVKFKNSLMED